MGYQDVTLYRLKFADRDGLEVLVEGLSTGDLLDLMELTDKLGPDPAKVEMTTAARPVVESLMETLAKSLVEWNVEDRHDQPVPMTVAGLKTLRFPLVMDIVSAWMSAQTDVSDDLGKGSTSGASSAPELQIPMGPRSPSPGS